MPRSTTATATARRRQRLLASGVTYNKKDFFWALKKTPGRINMVGEGDSWFAYPREHIIIGPRANILDYVCKSISGSKKANMLRIASNGDEAVQMLAGDQKHTMAEILKEGAGNIQLILFSGGGNDVVGKWDMERLLNKFEPGFSARKCINEKRFKRKLQQIRLAYEELVELRDEYAPAAQIVTHTYDYVQPNEKSAKFLAGLVAQGPWISTYLKEKGIPERLWLGITKHLLGDMRAMLQDLSAMSKNKDKLFVVNTQGLLRPGHGSDWKDEMHPSSSGFKKVARKYYKELKRLQPGLPAFKN